MRTLLFATICLVVAFVAPRALSAVATPQDDIIAGGNDVRSAYVASGAQDQADSFPAGLLKETVESEKQKTLDCEELASSALARATDATTEGLESEEQCRQAIEKNLEQIDDKDEREKVRKQMLGTCNEMKAVANASTEEKEKKRKEVAQTCRDLMGSSIEAIDEASKKTQEIQSAELQSCPHDYSFQCPEGWFDKGDGSTCEAPASYSGPCSTLGAFATDAEKKKTIEQKCVVHWPCLIMCDRDYSSLCPEGWTDAGGGKCNAPFTYSGRCGRTKLFAQMNDKDKDEWSARCGINWPCLPPCQREYNSNCPQAWADKGNGVCEAAEQYSGPCGLRESVGGFDENMKKLFEKKCLALYPCKPSCLEDYSNACPKGWLSTSFARCSPPETYLGPCKDETDFEGKTEDDKKKFSVKCGVSWPCREDCKRDFSVQCPLEWIQRGVDCYAPESYTGPCSQKKRFGENDTGSKIAAMKECNVYWPCEGEALVRPMLEGGKEATGKKGTGGTTSPLGGGRLSRLRIGTSGPIVPDTGDVIGASA